MKKHYKRLSYNDRIQLEALLQAETKISKIATILEFHISAIYREIKRGAFKHLNGKTYEYNIQYSADIAQRKADFNRQTQGKQPKLQHDYLFVKYIEEQILIKKQSPQAILYNIRNQDLKFNTSICLSTLYNYIRKGMFLNVKEKDLIYKGKRKKKQKQYKKPCYQKGISIEKRPKAINERIEFGHWEIDSIIGKREESATLICLTERKTRYELIFKTDGKTVEETEKIIKLLKKSYGTQFEKIFKSFTCDNGTEFKTLYNCPVKTFYCHPYSSSERGSNENQNRFIRRFIPKGTPIETIKSSQLCYIQDFINRYPRKLFNGQSSKDLFESEL